MKKGAVVNNSKSRGFTLLETLIAFFVLTIGLLGAVALQAKAKQASYDSLQRTAALSLAQDIIQRIRVNDTAALVALYDVDFTSTYEITTVQSCVDSFCSSAQVAAYDIIQWKKAIKAKELTGAMADASVCINPVLSAGVSGVDVEVVISWGGRQDIAQNTENTAIECGSSTENRRVVVVNSFIFIRA